MWIRGICKQIEIENISENSTSKQNSGPRSNGGLSLHTNEIVVSTNVTVYRYIIYIITSNLFYCCITVTIVSTIHTNVLSIY